MAPALAAAMNDLACARYLIGGGRICAVTMYHGVAFCRRHLAEVVADETDLDAVEWQARIGDATERSWPDR